MDVKEIINIMPSREKEDIDIVTKAYNFAKEAHKNHQRYSGEPYFGHLFETAKNLAKQGMDSATIAAGFLHDTLEDTNTTEETIEKEFGQEILFLIQGVTKLGQVKYRGARRHLESLRKFFIAISKDLRIIIIKLNDRLHNMQTLEHVPVEKQRRIALETLEVYAPLAYRLGMRKLNRELEDLAFEYVYPEEYKKLTEDLSEYTRNSEKRMEKIVNNIKKALAKDGMRNFRTSYRTKGLYSLYKKLLNKKTTIGNVYDFFAVRIIVPTELDCYRALGIIHNSWRPLLGRIKDYIAVTKPNGYQSLHTTIFTGDGGVVEVQIRTEKMHMEAEYGIASHFVYKEGGRKSAVKNFKIYKNLLGQKIPAGGKTVMTNSTENKNSNSQEIPLWIKQIATENSNSTPGEFITNLRCDFLRHRVFVFTPKGDVVDLPIDSSPIDFAYTIHSNIGDHVSGAIVNHKLVSLNTKLHNGDIVEIVTKESAKPSSKWVDFAQTSIAKKHIKNALDGKK